MDKKILKMLIIEDNPDDAELELKELERKGFILDWKRVETEKDFIQALKEKPDLILADYMLPSFSGPEALKIQQRLTPDIPLIIITGTVGEEQVVECMKAGATDYVLKDNLSRLAPVVKRALKEAEEHEERREAEEALKESEEKLSTILNSMPDVVLQLDTNLKILWANKATIKLNPQAVGQSCYIALPGRNEICPDCPIVKALKTGKIEQGIVHLQSVTGVGESYWDDIGIPIKDSQGKITSIVKLARNITEKIKAEEELCVSEQRFRDMANLLPQIIFEIDINGNLNFVNKQAFESFGYSKEEYEKGINVLQTLIPEDRVRAKENIQNVLYGKDIGNPEYTALRRDGSPFPILIYSSTILKDNKPIGLRGIIVDISERKLSEEKLRESEKKYRSLTENMSDIVYSMDINGILTYMSPQIRKYGVESETIISKSLLEFIHPDDHEKIMKEYQKTLVTGIEFPSTFRILDAKGGVHWFEDIGKIQRDKDGNITGIAGVLRDITDRKKAEEKLKQSEKNYRDLFNNATDAIYIQDREGRFLEVNQGAIDMYGYPEEYFIGKTPEFLSAPGKNDLKKIIGFVEDAFNGKPRQYDFWGIRKNGEVFPKIVRSQKGIYLGKEVVVTYALDITERKQAEEQIRRELKEKELLLREIHHRVKNNLQVISGLLQLQKDEINTKEDALKGFAASQDRILAMAKAYELLLSSEYMSEVSIAKYIESLTGQLKRNYDIHHKVKISYSLSELNVSIEILDRLGLILNEIITNSIKYAFEGRDSGKINIELRETEKHIVIKISDDGIGIPEKIDMDNPDTLGLSLVEMLMLQLRGKLSLDRKNGTSFTLEIPKEICEV